MSHLLILGSSLALVLAAPVLVSIVNRLLVEAIS